MGHDGRRRGRGGWQKWALASSNSANVAQLVQRIPLRQTRPTVRTAFLIHAQTAMCLPPIGLAWGHEVFVSYTVQGVGSI